MQGGTFSFLGYPEETMADQHHGACQRANEVITLIGDKWSVHIVMHLAHHGLRRFSEIRQAIDGISQKMLTVTLRGLERDGYVRRTVHPVIPPRVDYELTALGEELAVPLKALGDWAIANHSRVMTAREDYDARDGLPNPMLAVT